MRYAVVVLLALSLSGCGGVVAVGGAATPGQLAVVSGNVTSVQLSSVASNGKFVQVTFVSLQTSGMTHQLTFCGNNANQFPMNTSVTVNFNPGQDCNQISVVITG
jgi:hypothetical protein